MKVKELQKGSILWCYDDIVGIVGATVDMEKYGEREAMKICGNQYDWELLPERK